MYPNTEKTMLGYMYVRSDRGEGSPGLSGRMPFSLVEVLHFLLIILRKVIIVIILITVMIVMQITV